MSRLCSLGLISGRHGREPKPADVFSLAVFLAYPVVKAVKGPFVSTDHPYFSFMRHAVDLALRARWRTAPNPCVGAVLVRDGKIVAEGWHKGPGLAHAEVEALADAEAKGVTPADCTLVVTLEPCSHYGRTPPCTEAILAAGIKHVVIGCLDPTPTAGGGAEFLRSKGVKVETGVNTNDCEDLIADFLVWQNSRYPYTVLKLATTMDGRIATRSGHSQWITSERTRHEVHALRKYMGAILVGGNTFYYDNPRLTYRPAQGEAPEGFEQPLAVVVTSRLPETDAQYELLQSRPQKTIFWTTIASAASPKAEALRKAGAHVIGLPSEPRPSPRGSGMRAELDLREGLANLREEFNCYYALCEGGGRLGLALLSEGLAQELVLHMAPKILGDNEATPLFDGRSPLNMNEAMQMRFLEAQILGDDLLVTMRPRREEKTEDQGAS